MVDLGQKCPEKDKMSSILRFNCAEKHRSRDYRAVIKMYLLHEDYVTTIDVVRH